jgi:dTMP kinase
MGRWANNGLQPDLTLLLDMPAEASTTRIKDPADRMERRGIEYLESVRQAFLRELGHSGPSTAVIDADQSPEAVWQDVKQSVDELLEKQS